MKPIPIFVLASLCTFGSLLHADITVVQKIEGMGLSTESTTKVKGDKTRVDAMPGMTMIMNGGSGDILNLMHAQKSYMKIPAEAAKLAVSKMMTPEAANAKPKLTPTGKKETINSYAAEEYNCEMGGRKITVWLTTALPNYQAALKEMTEAMGHGPMASAMQSFSVYSTDLPGFPIRTISEVAPGQSITATTVSLDTKPISDADFAVPGDYKEMSLPTLTPPVPPAPPMVKGTPGTK